MTGRSIYDIVSERHPNAKTGALTPEYDGYYAQLQKRALSRADDARIWQNIAPILTGSAPNPAGNATNYYAPTAMHPRGTAPSWAKQAFPVGQLGRHVYYALPYAGRPAPDSDPAQPFGGRQSPAEARHTQHPLGVSDGSFPATQQTLSRPSAAADTASPDWYSDQEAGDLQSPPEAQDPLSGAPPPGGLPSDHGDLAYGAGSPARAPGPGDAPGPPDRGVRPEDIANFGHDNAHALALLLGKPPQGAPAQDPLAASLMARSLLGGSRQQRS